MLLPIFCLLVVSLGVQTYAHGMFCISRVSFVNVRTANASCSRIWSLGYPSSPCVQQFISLLLTLCMDHRCCSSLFMAFVHASQSWNAHGVWSLCKQEHSRSRLCCHTPLNMIRNILLPWSKSAASCLIARPVWPAWDRDGLAASRISSSCVSFHGNAVWCMPAWSSRRHLILGCQILFLSVFCQV